MEKTELRIGSIVAYPATGMTRIQSGREIDENEFEPVLLDESLMNIFGFEKHGVFKNTYKAGMNIIVKAENSGYNYYLGNTAFNVRYAHQLQNLYLALTGKELPYNV